MKKLNTIKIIACLSTILVMSLDAARRKRAPNDSCWSRVSNAFSGCLRKTTRALAVSTLIIPGTASPLPCDNTPFSYNPIPGNNVCKTLEELHQESLNINPQYWKNIEDPTGRLAPFSKHPLDVIPMGTLACNGRNIMLRARQRAINELQEDNGTQKLTTIESITNEIQEFDIMLKNALPILQHAVQKAKTKEHHQ